MSSWQGNADRAESCDTWGLHPTTTASPYKGHRFPHELIRHAVWLDFRFSLSYRDVEELLAERGSIVTYETVRQWCLKFGQQYANQLRRRRPKTGDKWHVDAEVPLLDLIVLVSSIRIKLDNTVTTPGGELHGTSQVYGKVFVTRPVALGSDGPAVPVVAAVAHASGAGRNTGPCR